MTTPDPFVHDDAAYVLGALSDSDRVAFEEHLSTCVECTARVHEVAGLPGLLASVSMDDFTESDSPPDTLLPGLLRRATAERRRRNRLVAGFAGLAAACLVTLTVVVWPSADRAPGPAPQAMTAVVASPVHATATLVAKKWGTEIDLVCTYDGTVRRGGYAYGLVVTDQTGRPHSLGTWTLSSGGQIRFASGTALTPEQIAKVEITGPGDRPLLRLTH